MEESVAVALTMGRGWLGGTLGSISSTQVAALGAVGSVSAQPSSSGSPHRPSDGCTQAGARSLHYTTSSPLYSVDSGCPEWLWVVHR